MTGAEILKFLFEAAIKAGAGELAKGGIDLAKKAWAKLKAKFAGEPEVLKALESAEASKSESELANVSPFLDMERVRKSDFWNELMADVQQIQQQINMGNQKNVTQNIDARDSATVKAIANVENANTINL
ncbi:MAG: hypothetical protein DCF19_07270 [Pseudanabaena frigida]|uniref:Uncharacterized protein n=1 Tax=Pseudanabaena frigida TaxID=945775 RepID=A0A2W4WD10_9CYAN|nr:MAG: hypothetical protein DCF19_07270 [Pseudanabaena frigida]